MREIKFRAISNGKMQFGDYCSNPEPHIMFLNDNSELDVAPCDKQTVGQFTGLSDKNGLYIYEGDIVKSGNGRIWEIRFGEYQYHDNLQSTGFYMFSKSCSFPVYSKSNIEVIGNIHSNPELL